MYAMLATSLGFAAMFISTVPMIQSFGLVAMIGIMSRYCISLVGIPAVAQVIHYKPKQQAPQVCYAVGEDACDTLPAPKKSSWSYGQFLTSTSVKIARNPVPILLIAALIAVIGFQIDPLIPIEANENNFVPSDMPAKIQMDKVTRILGATSTADFYVEGGRVTDLDTIQWMKSFQDFELSKHSELTSSTSIVTYILAYNGGEMPLTQSQLNRVLDKIPSGVKDQYISGSMRGVIHFGTISLQIPQEEDLKKVMVSDITFLQPPPGITVQPVGSFDIMTTLIGGLSSSKDDMTYLGFGLIFVFLALVYRHVHAISPLIPIVLVVGWNSVAMYILGISYSPLTATLGSMTIGVAAEYTILVMERYSEEEERLHDHIAAIQESVNRIGTAITVSGLATFFGFSALCLASFPITSNFGISTLIAVGFSLIGAIFIMPAVLSLMGQFTEWLEKRKVPPQSTTGDLMKAETPDQSKNVLQKAYPMKNYNTVALLILAAVICCGTPALGADKYLGGTPGNNGLSHRSKRVFPGTGCHDNGCHPEQRNKCGGIYRSEHIDTGRSPHHGEACHGGPLVRGRSDQHHDRPAEPWRLPSPGMTTASFTAKITSDATLGEYTLPLTVQYQVPLQQPRQPADKSDYPGPVHPGDRDDPAHDQDKTGRPD